MPAGPDREAILTGSGALTVTCLGKTTTGGARQESAVCYDTTQDRTGAFYRSHFRFMLTTISSPLCFVCDLCFLAQEHVDPRPSPVPRPSTHAGPAIEIARGMIRAAA